MKARRSTHRASPSFFIIKQSRVRFFPETYMKVGIIRCQQTEDLCQGRNCFTVAKEGKGVFAGLGQVEILGFVSCGGCPGKRAALRAKIMIENGAQAIVFSTCAGRGSSNGSPCPHFQLMHDMVVQSVGESVKILDHSY